MDYTKGLEFTDRNKLYDRIRELESEISDLKREIKSQKEQHQKMRLNKNNAIRRLRYSLNEKVKPERDKAFRGACARFLKSLKDRGLIDWNNKQIADACFLSYIGVREALKDAK